MWVRGDQQMGVGNLVRRDSEHSKGTRSAGLGTQKVTGLEMGKKAIYPHGKSHEQVKPCYHIILFQVHDQPVISLASDNKSI